MGPISKASGDGWDQQDLGQASGRDHQGSGRVGGFTKASKLQADPAKASTTHSAMATVTFLFDEKAQHHGSDHLSRTACSSGGTTSGAIIATKDVRIVKVNLIFR